MTWRALCAATCVLALPALAADPAQARVHYRDALALLERTRAALLAEWEQAPRARRPQVVARSRDALLAAFEDTLFPAWEGTPWEFYGTSEVPGEGTIACGYYVSTLLRDAGLRVQRVELARQASEHIVRTLAAAPDILRFRDAEPGALLEEVRRRHGEGLFVVGMDYHVAFLRLDAEGARLCHSAVLEPRHATCEPAATSPGFVSRYHVVGPALSDAVVLRWLQGQALPTAR